MTVIDLASGKPRAEIVTGLHASALAVSPDGRYVVCANAASDTLSVIDTRTDTVAETIWAKPSPADLFGAQPNALAFDPSGRTLYVANGTQNAVAVVAFDPSRARVEAAGTHPRGLVPRRPRLRRPAPDAARRQHQGSRRPPEAVRGGRGAAGRHRVQLAPLPRVALAGAAARDERAARPERDGLAQPPPRAHRGGPPAAAPRPARPRRARADRRAEPHQARRLRDQGEPHLRPGARRRRGRQRRPVAVHLRRAGHAQPAQAGARVRAARQHLLRRHPQRRRPPVEHDRDRHGLPGALLRRLAAQLPRRHGRGRGRRPRLLPRGLPLGQRAAARRERSATTASSWPPRCGGATRARRARRRSS